MSGKTTDPLRVLCMSPDGSAAAGVATMLASLPDFVFATRTAKYAAAPAETRDLDLVIVVVENDLGAGLRMIEALRKNARAAHLVAVSPDDDPETIVGTVRAGADEHLSLPLSQHDLLKTCIKVAEIVRGAPTHEERGGALWVVYGPKGGVGVTTVAVNLGIALRAIERDVALVDLDVSAGDAAFFLNVKPTSTLRDLITGFDRLDAAFIHAVMTRHPSGLSILAAPSFGRGEPLVEPTAEQTIDILELVTSMHELTLVNTKAIPSAATRAVLTTADRLFLVTDLTVPSLRACARTVDWLVGEGVDISAVEVIVNRYNPRGSEVSLADVSRTVAVPVRAMLPCDDAAALAAANAGRPLATGTPLQRAIAEIVAPGGSPAEAKGIRRSLVRLFSGNAA